MWRLAFVQKTSVSTVSVKAHLFWANACLLSVLDISAVTVIQVIACLHCFTIANYQSHIHLTQFGNISCCTEYAA